MKNYDNLFLPAEGIEESKSFYTNTLGLSVKFEFTNQGMVAFKIGNEEPAIILKDKKKFPTAKPTIWIEVENVKNTYELLLDKGVVFLSKPFQIRTGWAVEFQDPAGNQLGITDYITD